MDFQKWDDFSCGDEMDSLVGLARIWIKNPETYTDTIITVYYTLNTVRGLKQYRFYMSNLSWGDLMNFREIKEEDVKQFVADAYNAMRNPIKYSGVVWAEEFVKHDIEDLLPEMLRVYLIYFSFYLDGKYKSWYAHVSETCSDDAKAKLKKELAIYPNITDLGFERVIILSQYSPDKPEVVIYEK